MGGINIRGLRIRNKNRSGIKVKATALGRSNVTAR